MSLATKNHNRSSSNIENKLQKRILQLQTNVNLSKQVAEKNKTKAERLTKELKLLQRELDAKNRVHIKLNHAENEIKTLVADISNYKDVVKKLKIENKNGIIQQDTLQRKIKDYKKNLDKEKNKMEPLKDKLRLSNQQISNDKVTIKELEVANKNLKKDVLNFKNTQLELNKLNLNFNKLKDKYHNLDVIKKGIR